MNSKPHRTNSDFQLRHFMVGDCKTADGAWNLMYGQKIDIEVKIKHAEIQRLRREAKICVAKEILSKHHTATTEAARLEAQADILEMTAGEETWRLNLEGAIAELATIEKLMSELEPHRKYSHLPMLEAAEAAQQEEWLLELKSRAENHLIASGTIPPDELRFMRNHPDFETELVPHITQLTHKISQLKSGPDGLLLLSKPLQLAQE